MKNAYKKHGTMADLRSRSAFIENRGLASYTKALRTVEVKSIYDLCLILSTVVTGLIDVGRCCREQGRFCFCLPFQATPRARFSSNFCSISALVATSAAPGRLATIADTNGTAFQNPKQKVKAQKLFLSPLVDKLLIQPCLQILLVQWILISMNNNCFVIDGCLFSSVHNICIECGHPIYKGSLHPARISQNVKEIMCMSKYADT